jgi:hypothetical protein
MAMIYQASAGVANAKKLTISMWCRAHYDTPSPGTDLTMSLLEFGAPYSGTGVDCRSNIRMGVGDGYGGRVISVQLAGEVNSVAMTDIVSGSSDPGMGSFSWPMSQEGTFGPPPSYDSSSFITPLGGGVTVDVGDKLGSGKWFHMIVAADYSNAVSYSNALSAGNRFYVRINGTTQGVYAPSGIALSDGTTYQKGSGFNLALGPFLFVGGNGTVNANIPAFDFALSGTEIGIPSQRDSNNKNTNLIDMADVQIWLGTYIDPTNELNFEQFVIRTPGGGGYAQPPSVAAEAFGPQTYLFSGARDNFLINQGTGGAFSNTGTITGTSGVGY